MLSNIARLNARRGLRCGLVCTVALVVFLGGDREASATFPGRNGDIFVTRWDISSQQSSGGAIRVDAVSGQIRDGLSVCHHQFYGSPDTLSDSTYCYRSGPAAISPDGRTAAVIGKDVHDGIAPLSEGLRLLSLTDGERQLIPFTNPADIATANVGGGYERVRWSPDGRQVLIDRPLTSTGGHAVYVAPVDDPNQMRFVAEGSDADWSSEGRIVLVGNSNLYVGRIGSAFMRLTYRGGIQPSWSPRGKWLAFVRKKHLYKIASAGGKPVRIARLRGEAPTWSPDGKQIALAAGCGSAECSSR